MTNLVLGEIKELLKQQVMLCHKNIFNYLYLHLIIV